MKKSSKIFVGLLAALVVLFTSNFNLHCQTEVNDNVISAGVGFGSPYSYTGTARPAFMVMFDHGFKKISDIGTISIGGLVGYQSLTYSYYLYDNYHANAMYFAVRGLFHFTMLDIDKLDVYGGVSLGLRVYTVKYDAVIGNYSNSDFNPYVGLYGGARYFLTDNFAVFSELLYDVSWIKLGVSLKF